MPNQFRFVRHTLATALFTIFILLDLAWAAPKETSLYNFNGGSNDGSAPIGGLVADHAGNLYGTTGTGGSYTDCSPFGQTCGVVFELSPNGGSWTETVLYTFTGGADGGEPLAGLAIDAQGNLYGTTAIGGTFGNGTVFMLSSGSWTESVLYSFRGGSDGSYPQAAVTLHNGSIYGTTYAGGGNSCLGAPSGCGTIFQLQPGNNGWTENVLYRFTNGADGAFPYASLILDPAGNLYGATTQGGYLSGNCAPYGCGNVFQLKHGSSGWTLNSLHAFTYDTDGSAPSADCLLALMKLSTAPHRAGAPVSTELSSNLPTPRARGPSICYIPFPVPMVPHPKARWSAKENIYSGQPTAAAPAQDAFSAVPAAPFSCSPRPATAGRKPCCTASPTTAPTELTPRPG